MEIPLERRLQLREKPAGRSPVMFQHWNELLFLHWEWDPVEIQKTLPGGLFVDTFEGKAYLGLIPFFMRRVRPRFTVCVPGISNFMETNLRTYVYDENGNPGVWFYSLDCNQFLAVQLAKTFFGLPYFYARMHAGKEVDVEGELHFYSVRRGGESLNSRFCYRLGAECGFAPSGTLSFFLIERYLLFSFSQRSGLRSGRVHHSPYPLLSVEPIISGTTVFSWNGFNEPNLPPVHATFSRGVEVEIYSLENGGGNRIRTCEA